MPEFPETAESLILQVVDSSNRAAWDQFEQLYRPVIFRIAVGKGLQEADALDLVQQVLHEWCEHRPDARFLCLGIADDAQGATVDIGEQGALLGAVENPNQDAF